MPQAPGTDRICVAQFGNLSVTFVELVLFRSVNWTTLLQILLMTQGAEFL